MTDAEHQLMVLMFSRLAEQTLADSREGTAVDGHPRQRADDGLGCRPELLRPPDSVAVKVLFEHQLPALVEQDAVDVFKKAPSRIARTMASGCGHFKIGARNVPDGDSVMEVGRRMIAIVRRRVLPFGTGPGQRSGFRRKVRSDSRVELAIGGVPGHLSAQTSRGNVTV